MSEQENQQDNVPIQQQPDAPEQLIPESEPQQQPDAAQPAFGTQPQADAAQPAFGTQPQPDAAQPAFGAEPQPQAAQPAFGAQPQPEPQPQAGTWPQAQGAIAQPQPQAQPWQQQPQPQQGAWQQPQPGAPYGQGADPNAQAGTPYGQGADPNAQAGAPYGQGGTPYGQPNAPYGQPGSPYGQPAGAYGQPPAPVRTQAPADQVNGKAVGALVCGILAILGSPLIIPGIILGAVAIVLAIMVKKQGRDGKATAGFICGIVGAALSIVTIIATVVVISAASSAVNSQPVRQPTDLAKEVPGTIITDDALCTLELTKIEFATNGDLKIWFKLTNNASSQIKLRTDTNTETWELNGEKVKCECHTWVDPGKTKEEELWIPAAYLDVSDVDDIDTISGSLSLVIGDHEGMRYRIDLY